MKGRQVVQTWQLWVCDPSRQLAELPITVTFKRRSLAEQDVDISFFLLCFISSLLFEMTYERNHDKMNEIISTNEEKDGFSHDAKNSQPP